MSAACPPQPRSTWWSRQLWAMFVRPPVNHRKVGGSGSKTVSHFLNHGRSDAASAQKASGSSMAAARQRSTSGLMSRAFAVIGLVSPGSDPECGAPALLRPHLLHLRGDRRERLRRLGVGIGRRDGPAVVAAFAQLDLKGHLPEEGDLEGVGEITTAAA